VRVFCTTLEGREPLLAVRRAGELIGELAAIDGELQPRMATIVAMEPVLARVIPAVQFLEFVVTRPEVGVALLRSLTARLRAADRRRVEFGGYDTLHRLASLVLEMAEEHGVADDEGIRIDVALSQEELANMIGASRESVARAVARLRSSGALDTRRRGITVIDIEQLRRYAV
jgi:CRP-like cAMP-binding protein